MNNSVLITPKNKLCNVENYIEDVPNNYCVSSSLSTTPVQNKRCIHKKDNFENQNGTLNITNLNMLFDSNIIYNSPKLYYNHDCYYNNSEKSNNYAVNNNCNSNITMADQNNGQLNNEHDSCNFGTPKTSQNCCIGEHENYSKYNNEQFGMSIKSRKILNSPSLENSQSFEYESIKVTKSNEFKETDLNNKNKQLFNRNSSEHLYFSPGLLNSKQYSTPIINLTNHTKFQKSENDEYLNQFEKTMVNDLTGNNILSPHTPKNCYNAFEKTPPSVAIERAKSNKFNHCLIKDQNLIETKRKLYISPKKLLLSPKKLNNSLKCGNVYINQSLDYFSGVNCIIGKVKKYKTVMKWPTKLYNICSNLGDSVKTSIHTALKKVNCTSAQLNSSKTEPDSSTCKCKEYEEEIHTLHLNIQQLMEELCEIKKYVKQKANQNIEEVLQVTNDLNILRQELKIAKDTHQNSKDIENLRLDIDFLKNQFNVSKPSVTQQPCVTEAPKAPPPPPPLPPPLPPTNFSSTISKLKIEKKERNATGNTSSRPVISLEDILKVKLKKAVNRSISTPNRRNSTSNVNILSQVKLKPASRSLRNASIDSGDFTTPKNLTTSPHSSLCRLLTDNGSSSWKLKRLRKVSGYSLDSIHRRNIMGKRERDYTCE